MWFKLTFLTACTAALGVAGLRIGHLVHGAAPMTAVACIAGAAGGFRLGAAVLDVLRRHRENNRPRA